MQKVTQIFIDLLQIFFSKSKRVPAENKQPTTDSTKVVTVESIEITTVKEAIVAVEPAPVLEVPKVEPKRTGFMICPISENNASGNPLTPYTVKISAVIDHSGTAIDPDSKMWWGVRAKDQRVEAFNGEIGDGAQCPQEPCGYPKKDSSEFFKSKEINYVGVSSDGGKYTLQYDGHAGYDFPYLKMTPIVAPAVGNLFKAAKGKDAIYNADWEFDHSFYIRHENGYITWFRHCEKLEDSIEASIQFDLSKSCRVEKGQIIAYVGNAGTRAVHLHFEVRNEKNAIVDPYGDSLWERN